MANAWVDKNWLPPDISTHGSDIDFLIHIIHWFMLALFVGWGIFFVYCLWRFRRRPGQKAQYDQIKAKPSKYAEIGVVIFEAFLLLGLSIPVWGNVKKGFPKKEENPLRIRVTAQQFAWNIHYPGPDGVFGPTDPKLVDETANPIGLDRKAATAKDDVTSLNTLRIPVDRPVIVELTSKDVIHSFWIPFLRVKQDVVPGMQIPIWFKPTQTSDVVRQKMTRTVHLPVSEDRVNRFLMGYANRTVMEDCRDSSGTVILAKGGSVTEDGVRSLIKAGVKQAALAPAEPIEIQCAQLCGNSHFKMRGACKVLSAEEFDQWMIKEVESAQEEKEDEWE